MPKSKVNDPITDQEIVYARLILSGKMSDQEAAEVAGLNPTTAAYTKAKPRVQAWMQEHRAATEKQLLEHEAEQLRRKSATRERVLARLWDIADRSFEETKGSAVCQIKALAMIVALEELIPDRRARSAEKSAPPSRAQMYQAEWLRKQNANTHSGPVDDQEAQPPIAHPASTPEASEPSLTPSPTHHQPTQSQEATTVPHSMTFAEENSSPYTSFVPDTRNASLFQRTIFPRRRR